MRAGVAVAVVSAVKVDVSSHVDSPVNALKQQFSEVEAQIKSAGQVTPGVYSTVKKLQKMVESIIEPAILESHAADQLLVLTVFREIISCDAQYKKFLAGDKSKAQAALKSVKTEWTHCGGSVEELKQKYSECLDNRDVLVRHNNTVCCQEFAVCSSPTGYGDCEVVKLESGFVGCNYKDMTGEQCFAHAKSLVAPLHGYFSNQDKKYEALRFECAKFTAATKAKVAECAYLQEAVNAKVMEANERAEEFNQDAENTEANCKTACSEYQECRTKTISAYQQVVGPCETTSSYGGGDCVKNRENDRKSEWEATQTIACLLKHYCTGGKFEDEQVENCKASIDSYHLAVTYPQVPEEMPCEIPDCGRCPGCDECVDRPYYQYETPCYGSALEEVPVCMEEPECPEWCGGEQPTAAPTTAAPTTTTTTRAVVHLEVGQYTDSRSGTFEKDKALNEGGITHAPKTQTFSKAFTQKPVVLAGVVTMDGGHPVVPSVEELTATSATMRLHEPDCYDDWHTTETLAWTAMEAGIHETDAGVKFEIGSALVSGGGWMPIKFSAPIEGDVVVVPTIQSKTDEWTNLRIQKVTSTGFEVLLEAAKKNEHVKGSETVGFMAIPAGDGTIAGRKYHARLTPTEMTEAWRTYSFPATSNPRVFAGMTHNGGDTANLRMKGLTGSSLQFRVHEPSKCGWDDKHPGKEQVHLVVLEG